MEKIFYEYRPYAFVAFGTMALAWADQKSALLYVSAVSLVFCASVIIHVRRTHRKFRSPFRRH